MHHWALCTECLTIRVCWHVFLRLTLFLHQIWVKTEGPSIGLCAPSMSSGDWKYFEPQPFKTIAWGVTSFPKIFFCEQVFLVFKNLLLKKVIVIQVCCVVTTEVFKLALWSGQRMLPDTKPMCSTCPWILAKLCSGLGLAGRSFLLFSKLF